MGACFCLSSGALFVMSGAPPPGPTPAVVIAVTPDTPTATPIAPTDTLTRTPTDTPTPPKSPTAEWYIPAGWGDHTEYASCPSYPSIQSFGFVSPGVVELTREAAVKNGDLLEWCFKVRFTRLAWWVKYYQDNQPSIFGTTEPESLAVYFRRLPAGAWVEIEGIGQVLPAGPGQDGVSVKNSPVTFRVFCQKECQHTNSSPALTYPVNQQL